jgi:hypothetical protein
MSRMLWLPDAESATRAQLSQTSRRADTFSGVDTISQQVTACTGVVLAVEDHGPSAEEGRRWRASIQSE